MDFFDVPNSLVVRDLSTYGRKVCLPIKRNCFATCNLLLKQDGQQHNCKVKKKSQSYLNPYMKGDKIMFQTRFIDKFNTNPNQPINGWGNFIKAEILDFDGNVIENDLNVFSSRRIVGWSGSFSYQIIEVDTSLFTQDNWHIRIWAENLGGAVTEELFSEPFYKEADKCRGLVYFESTYTNTDCCGNYYGLPPTNDNWIGTDLFQFSNRFAVLGSLYRDVGTLSYETFSDVTTKSTFQTPYIFKPLRPIPIYVSDWILKIVMGGQVKKINNIEVQADSVSPDNILSKGGQTFYYEFNIYTACEVGFFC